MHHTDKQHLFPPHVPFHFVDAYVRTDRRLTPCPVKFRSICGSSLERDSVEHHSVEHHSVEHHSVEHHSVEHHSLEHHSVEHHSVDKSVFRERLCVFGFREAARDKGALFTVAVHLPLLTRNIRPIPIEC